MTDFYTITINGVDLLVDAEDADFMERYQSAYDAMSANPADTLNDNPATVIRKYCQSYRNFFDALFGDGTAAAVFAGMPDNARMYDEVFTVLIKAILEQRMATALRLTEAAKRYVPRELV